MSDLVVAVAALLLLAWLGNFIASEVRSGGVVIRVFWLTVAAAFVGFLGVFLYAAGQPNW